MKTPRNSNVVAMNARYGKTTTVMKDRRIKREKNKARKEMKEW
jgi:hypothetical protein